MRGSRYQRVYRARSHPRSRELLGLLPLAGGILRVLFSDLPWVWLREIIRRCAAQAWDLDTFHCAAAYRGIHLLGAK
ncbi:hypothetical protein KCP73_12415 [Salmonella enterica subsp. enterica]|nr:hypothetical protein KCP73_12415 [Salmonella enterica subsp. enterica]